MIFSREEVFDNKIPDCILGIYYFIDGNQNGSVVIMNGNSVIDGFTIQNGIGGSTIGTLNSDSSGGGIYAVESSSPNLKYIFQDLLIFLMFQNN